MFNFFCEPSQAVFQSTCTISHSQASAGVQGTPVAPHTHWHGYYLLLYHSHEWVWRESCGLHFLVANDAEHLFMSLLAICIPSREKWLFRFSAHFLNWAVCLFYCWVVAVLYIFQILVLCQMYDLQKNFLSSCRPPTTRKAGNPLPTTRSLQCSLQRKVNMMFTSEDKYLEEFHRTPQNSHTEGCTLGWEAIRW